MTLQAELVLDCANAHGEGIFWNSEDRKIWWSDIQGRQIWTYHPETADARSFEMPDRVCCFGPRAGGGLIVAFDNRISLYNLESRAEKLVCEFEPGNPNTRLNDGRTDRQGRFIAGGMNEGTGVADSSVIRVDGDLSVHTLLTGIACANSTCFSPDGTTMYFADTPDREILAFDYDVEGGTASNRRILASFSAEPGLPDGSCVDADGGVWNAEWEGRRVVRVAPNGEIDQIIEVPVWKPTCCAFGGPGLDTLYITTSRLMSDEETLRREPTSGGLLAFKTGRCGLADVPFCG